MKKSQIALLLVCAYCLAPMFGAAQKKVGSSCSSSWESNEYNTTYKRQTYDFSSCINQPGNYTITFAYKSGSHLLASRNAVIEVDGKKVASFDKEVSAGLNPSKWSYTFNVQSKPKKVTLAVDLRTNGGSNSNGTIKVVRNGNANSVAAKLDGDYNFFAPKSSGSTSQYTTTTTTTTTTSGNTTVTRITRVTSPFNNVVMKWKSGDYTTSYQRKTFDFTEYIGESGNYTIQFAYTGGRHMLVSRNAVIEVDGKQIASFDKEVSAGLNPKSWSYTFNVQSKPKSVKLTLDLFTSGGTESSGNISVVRNGSATHAAATMEGGYSVFSTNSSNSKPGKTKWEQKSAPVKIPNELIIYNKNSAMSRKPQRTEVVKFKDQPKVAEYTTGDIKRPEKYLEFEAYPVNEEVKRENKAAARNDRVDNGTLYIAEGTTTIYKNAYRGRTDINKVVLPESVTTIGDYAFANMPNLTTVSGKDWKLKYIGDHAFDQDMKLVSFPFCYELKYLGVCAFREVGLTDGTRIRAYFVGDSAFMGAAFKKVGWASAKAIGDYAFKDCKELVDWDFIYSDGDYSACLEYVGHGAFLGTGLTKVKLQEGTQVGIDAFEPNTEITWNLNMAKSEEKVRPKWTLDYYIDVMPEVNNFDVLMPEDYDPVTDVNMPMILYLHGRSMSIGEPEVAPYGPMPSMKHGYKILENEKAIVVSPNAISKEGWSSAKLHKLYEFLKAHYAFDHNRFYVIGLSMGGWGTMNYVNRYPDEVAACIAFCGGCDATKPCGLNQVPTWIVHAKDDEMTSVACSDRVVKAMKECGNTNLLKYSRLEQGGHSLIYYFDNYNLYDWLLLHNRKNRTFNHNIDFIANPQMAVDEDCYTLGVDYYDFYYQEVTPEVLSKIKQRTPNAQGTPVPPKVKPAEAPVKVEPVTRIPTGPKKGKR